MLPLIGTKFAYEASDLYISTRQARFHRSLAILPRSGYTITRNHPQVPLIVVIEDEDQECASKR